MQMQGSPSRLFICQDHPHCARDCPMTEKLNALVMEEDNSDYDGGPSRVNPLQLLNAIKAENVVSQKGLMYVEVLINAKIICAMMEVGSSITSLPNE